MKWKCKRCEAIFDDSDKKCNCTESPSPWEPYIELQVEKVEVKPKARKLKAKWTFELGETIFDMGDDVKESIVKILEEEINMDIDKRTFEENNRT